MWELRTAPAPSGLESLGREVELRELDCGALGDLLAQGLNSAEAIQRLVAASLHIDGEPLGFERMQSMPGRFYGALNRAIPVVLALHDLASASSGPSANDDRPPGARTGTAPGEA